MPCEGSAFNNGTRKRRGGGGGEHEMEIRERPTNLQSFNPSSLVNAKKSLGRTRIFIISGM